MTASAGRRLLVVVGDFSLVEQVRLALPGDGFILQTAYSHLDGMYALEHGDFDVVLVEGGMASHKTGDLTLEALARLKETVPVIALITDGRFPGRQSLPPNVILSVPGQKPIRRTLMRALKLPASTWPDWENGEETLELADEVQTLFTLSQSLTEVLDLSEVLNRVVEAARNLTHAEEGMILLPDEEGGQLFLRAKVGIDIEIARNFRVKTEDTLAGHVFNSGHPVLVGAQGPQKVKTEYLVNALLYVPILYKGRCIGVLGVNNKHTDRVFNLRHQELLLNLASFAAVAIENAREHEETLERARELQALVEASHSINAYLALDRTLQTVCEQLVRLLNVNRADIYAWQPEANQLRAQARYSRTIWPSGQGPQFELSSRPALQSALDQGRAITLTAGHAALTSVEQDDLNRIGAEAALYLPVIGGGQTLGAIGLYYLAAPDDLPGMEAQHRAQHLALEVLATLPKQVEARQQGVLRGVEDILRLCEADWCEITVTVSEPSALALQVEMGSGVWLGAQSPSLDLRRYPDIVEALESQSPVMKPMDGRATPDGVRALLDSTRSRVVLGLPLVQRGRAVGLVVFGDARRGRLFDSRSVDLGRTLVAQAATALENARLFHELERSLRELRDTQDRLVQTARLSAMGELAAAVAHQINNPLTTIMVDSEMLLMDEPPDSRNYRSLQAISRAGKRAVGVARRLLAIARPTDPEAPPQPIDVADTIEGILSLVKSHIERDRIQVITDLPSEKLPPVWAAPGQLDDIWLNLVMNAHDALIGRSNAQIQISAVYCQERNELQVQIADNGPGIPAHLQQEIFRPFFTTKPPGEGTGLGLHICRQTAERIGGSITVTSVEGQGTTFLVRLPIQKGEN